jgi:hypothetical protein
MFPRTCYRGENVRNKNKYVETTKAESLGERGERGERGEFVEGNLKCNIIPKRGIMSYIY